MGSVIAMGTPANENELCDGAERDQAELRGLLDQTRFMLRRAQQIIERSRPRRPVNDQQSTGD